MKLQRTLRDSGCRLARDPFVPVYRIALAAYCVLTALWLPDGDAALVGADDGSLRLVHLATGVVQGYYSALVKSESGAKLAHHMTDHATVCFGGDTYLTMACICAANSHMTRIRCLEWHPA